MNALEPNGITAKVWNKPLLNCYYTHEETVNYPQEITKMSVHGLHSQYISKMHT